MLTVKLVKAKQGIINCSWGISVQFGLRVLGAQGVTVRKMHSLHNCTDFSVLSGFWLERDYSSVPFERRFISLLLCKCDHSL